MAAGSGWIQGGGLCDGPRRAPPDSYSTNGDFFVADSHAGEIKIFRGRGADGKPEQVSTFATGLKRPFGVNFYPPGANPQWVYVGNTDSVVRLPYKWRLGKLAGPRKSWLQIFLQVDITGRAMWFFRTTASGFSWPWDRDRISMIRTRTSRNFIAPTFWSTRRRKVAGVNASGIRNPVGLGVNPRTGELWCSVNERDELGDNLPSDYITHVQQGGFYGWPFYYLGGHPDPRLGGKHPELKDKVIVPDVLVQAHNASLGLTFYEGNQFPKEYSGDLFAAEHGSWNRATRGGYELVCVPLENGHASGVYEDFVTGFVTPEGNAWGRPVGVAVAKDGSLYFTDDGYKAIWRVSYTGK